MPEAVPAAHHPPHLPPPGTLLRLVHCESEQRYPQIFSVDASRKWDKGILCLASLDDPGGHLRINPKRKVDVSGSTGKWAQFNVSSGGGTGVFSLQSVGHQANTPDQPAYLGCDATTSRAALTLSAVSSPVFWLLEPVAASELASLPPAAPPMAPAPTPSAPKAFPAGFAEATGITWESRVRLAPSAHPDKPSPEAFAVRHGTDAMYQTFAKVPDLCAVQFARIGRTQSGKGGPKGHLRIHRDPSSAPLHDGTNKLVDSRGGHGAAAHFHLIPLPSHGPGVFALRCLAFRETEPTFLGIEVTRPHAVQAEEVSLVASAEPVPLVMVPLPADHQDPAEPKFDPSLKLTNSQRDEFRTQGFVILKNVVPLSLVEDAKRVVNHHLGTGPEAWTTGEDGVPKLGASSHSSVTDLIEQSDVWTLVQRMIGLDKVARPPPGQLAIRFPVVDTFKEGDCTETGEMQYHIDGMQNQTLIPFTILCKVPLSDQTQEGNGNFTVFPGSHRNPELLQWYADRLQDNITAATEGPPAPPAGGGGRGKPALGRPMQVCMAPGDCAIVHPHLAHCVGRNTSPNIRYSIIFRLQHTEKHQHLADLTLQRLIAEGPLVGIQVRPDWEEDQQECPSVFDEGTGEYPHDQV